MSWCPLRVTRPTTHLRLSQSFQNIFQFYSFNYIPLYTASILTTPTAAININSNIATTSVTHARDIRHHHLHQHHHHHQHHHVTHALHSCCFKILHRPRRPERQRGGAAEQTEREHERWHRRGTPTLPAQQRQKSQVCRYGMQDISAWYRWIYNMYHIHICTHIC